MLQIQQQWGPPRPAKASLASSVYWCGWRLRLIALKKFYPLAFRRLPPSVVEERGSNCAFLSLHDKNSFRPQEQFEFDATTARGNSNYHSVKGQLAPVHFPSPAFVFLLQNEGQKTHQVCYRVILVVWQQGWVDLGSGESPRPGSSYRSYQLHKQDGETSQ